MSLFSLSIQSKHVGLVHWAISVKLSSPDHDKIVEVFLSQTKAGGTGVHCLGNGRLICCTTPKQINNQII